MKKLLLTLCFIFSLAASKAQVEFAPPGSIWYHGFFESFNQHGGGANYVNANITRVQDSVVDNETVKVLQYHYFYVNRLSDCGNKILIKQKGDTVFMRNCHTGHTWQVLYNFAVTMTHTWTTTIMHSTEFGTTPITHTIMVNAVSSHAIQGIQVKNLSVSICYPDTNGLQCYGSQINEIYGDTYYTFNYFNLHRGSFDFSCYSSDDFMRAQLFGYNGCVLDVGILENKPDKNKLTIYPQPADQSMNVELGEYDPTLKTDIHVSDLSGRVLFTLQLSGSKTALDLSALNSGIYFLKILREEHATITQKIIKE